MAIIPKNIHGDFYVKNNSAIIIQTTEELCNNFTPYKRRIAQSPNKVIPIIQIRFDG